MAWIWDPNARRRKKQKEDLDKDYYKRQKVYNASKEKERERIAALRGKQDAQKIANRKPFYQKLMGAFANIGKDLVAQSGNVKPNALFTWDTPKRQRKRKGKRRTKKEKEVEL
ncbi:MAG: hypothetical protein ABSB71_08005 [Candidatus Bathyarchaeia archaeon]|jgi:hypothetical protein